MLVVTFASAPGLPNWGGLLRKVHERMAEPAYQCFDTLYVVDPSRSWYHGEFFLVAGQLSHLQQAQKSFPCAAGLVKTSSQSVSLLNVQYPIRGFLTRKTAEDLPTTVEVCIPGGLLRVCIAVKVCIQEATRAFSTGRIECGG